MIWKNIILNQLVSLSLNEADVEMSQVLNGMKLLNEHCPSLLSLSTTLMKKIIENADEIENDSTCENPLDNKIDSKEIMEIM